MKAYLGEPLTWMPFCTVVMGEPTPDTFVS